MYWWKVTPQKKSSAHYHSSLYSAPSPYLFWVLDSLSPSHFIIHPSYLSPRHPLPHPSITSNPPSTANPVPSHQPNVEQLVNSNCVTRSIRIPRQIRPPPTSLGRICRDQYLDLGVTDIPPHYPPLHRTNNTLIGHTVVPPAPHFQFKALVRQSHSSYFVTHETDEMDRRQDPRPERQR